jgi:hypothetical protein
VLRLGSKLRHANLVATLAAVLVLGGVTVALATSGAARGPSAQIAKKKSDRRVGAYRGTTEVGGTVSFRITRGQRVVGFTTPNVPVTCYLDKDNPYSGPPFTITAPPMKLEKGPEGGPSFLYDARGDTSGPAQWIHVDGKGAPGGGMKGNASMESWNGPPGSPGTEECYTGFVDWSATKVGGKKKK